MDDRQSGHGSQPSRAKQVDEVTVADTREFADVYLGFVYRLAVKQYEDDYLSMRQLITEEDKAVRRASEPKPKLVGKAEAYQDDRHHPKNRANAETKAPYKESAAKVKPQAYQKEVLAEQGRRRQSREHPYVDENRLLPTADPSVDAYSSRLEHNYRKLANGDSHHDHDSTFKKPSFKPSIPKAADTSKNPEINKLLRDAENKKHILQLQLRDVDQDIQRLKKIIVRPKHYLELNQPLPRPVLAPVYRHPTPPAVQQQKAAKEKSADSFREDYHSEKSENYLHYDYQGAPGYHDYSDNMLPKQIDNAAFIRKLNQEKKEREVHSF